MTRGRGFLIAAAILIGSVTLAVFLVSLAPEPERSEPPSQIPYVRTASAVAGSGAIPVHGAGTVRPSAEVDVAAQVGGRVVWVNPAFRSGRRVEAGATLFRIEEEDYVYRLREAEASLAARQSEYLEAQEEAALARAEYERYANREAGAAPLGLASPLTLREPQLNASRAALDRDEASVAEAKLALSRTRVRAPFDGFVREESVDVGQLVGVGQTVGGLIAAASVEVVVPLSDADAALIPGLWDASTAESDEPVEARVIAEYGDTRYAWRGHVDRAEATLDELSRTIDVIVRVPDPFASGEPVGSAGGLNGTPPLLLGKFVTVEIQGLAPQRYFRVRRAALQPGNVIWAVRDGGTLRIVPVRVLQRGDDEIFVTGPLEDGQAAVIGGIRYATDGMRVRTGER
ncbi:MAG: efflux RND transporter periplasmic adaptor subunit [Gammaproteobacteria bacterium]|nr:efflux RND transporter periplasmic adaptor subunit [Gammaproteobacteria bacterium]